MRYLVNITKEAFKKLDPMKDWSSVWIVDEKTEDSLVKAINKIHDELVED